MMARVAVTDAHVRLKLAVVVLIQVALLLSGAWLWQRDRDGDTGPTLVRLDPDRPPGTPLSVEEGFPAALARARQWNPEAWLFNVQAQIDWPADPDQAKTPDLPAGGWIIYLFAAPRDDFGDRGEVLSLMVDRASGIVLATDITPWTKPPERRLDLPSYPVSSVVALYAAELTGGADYRLSCPQFRHLMRLSLAADATAATPRWVVTYDDDRTPGRAGLRVEVDARSGEITRTELASTSC
jgi:hypothetical protein